MRASALRQALHRNGIRVPWYAPAVLGLQRVGHLRHRFAGLLDHRRAADRAGVGLEAGFATRCLWAWCPPQAGSRVIGVVFDRFRLRAVMASARRWRPARRGGAHTCSFAERARLGLFVAVRAARGFSHYGCVMPVIASACLNQFRRKAYSPRTSRWRTSTWRRPARLVRRRRRAACLSAWKTGTSRCTQRSRAHRRGGARRGLAEFMAFHFTASPTKLLTLLEQTAVRGARSCAAQGQLKGNLQ